MNAPARPAPFVDSQSDPLMATSHTGEGASTTEAPSAPAERSAPRQSPRPAQPQRDPRESAALFRLYRNVPLADVLEKLGAEKTGAHTWEFNGKAFDVSTDHGFQGWKNTTDNVGQKGAIDLVVNARGFKGSGQALAWLRDSFPEVADKVAEEMAKPEKAPATGGSVKGAQRPRLSREDLNALFERYKNVRLSEVLERLGAEPNQDNDKNKWKIPGLGNIITKGQKWQNVQTIFDKGFGGIDLVCHALGFGKEGGGRMKGLAWMQKEFGEEFGDDLLADDLDSAPKDFTPPERFPEISGKVLDYLVQKRGLPSSLVEAEIKSGKIYGSHPWNDRKQQYLTFITRCVFLGQASAELRDTDPDGFKGCCDGSQTDASGYQVRPAEGAPEYIMALTEAAIDALSYRAMFPGRFVMSTNGAGRFLLQFRVALEAVEKGVGVRLALDADMAGDLGAQRVFNAFYVRKALSHHLKVSEATVETWLLEGDLRIEVDQSPHHLFFNSGWQPSLKVNEAEILDGEGDEGARTLWKETNEEARPSIRLRVIKDLHERLQRGSTTLTVGEKGFNYVIETLNLRRDRPQMAKDWNEVLKKLGAGYAQQYDSCSRAGFDKGLPALPPVLEALRTPQDPSVSLPGPPEPPVASPAHGGASPRPAGMRR